MSCLKDFFRKITQGRAGRSDRELLQELADTVYSPDWSTPWSEHVTFRILDVMADRLKTEGKDKHPDLVPVAEAMARQPADKVGSVGYIHDDLRNALKSHATTSGVKVPSNPWQELVR